MDISLACLIISFISVSSLYCCENHNKENCFFFLNCSCLFVCCFMAHQRFKCKKGMRCKVINSMQATANYGHLFKMTERPNGHWSLKRHLSIQISLKTASSRYKNVTNWWIHLLIQKYTSILINTSKSKCDVSYFAEIFAQWIPR